MRGLKFLFLLVLAVVVLIASGYFIFKAPVANEIHESSITEPSSEEQKSEYSLKLSRGYAIISKPTFKVGDKFVYMVDFQEGSGNYTDEYTVDKIEVINDSKFFLVVDKKTFGNDTSDEYKMYNGLTEIYVNADDGTILKVVNKIPLATGSADLILKSDFGEDVLDSRNYFYVPWMLGLKEGLSWTTKVNSTNDDIVTEGRYEYKVTGVENINSVECFVVESTYSELSKEGGVWENFYKTIRWVSKKDRILVRSELYDYYVTGELEKNAEINLISDMGVSS